MTKSKPVNRAFVMQLHWDFFTTEVVVGRLVWFHVCEVWKHIAIPARFCPLSSLIKNNANQEGLVKPVPARRLFGFWILDLFWTLKKPEMVF
jgi:hypothetical protein